MINENPKRDLPIRIINMTQLREIINYSGDYKLNKSFEGEYFIEKKENEEVICKLNIFSEKYRSNIAYNLSTAICVTDKNSNIIGYIVPIDNNVVYHEAPLSFGSITIYDFLDEYKNKYNEFNISNNILLFNSRKVFLHKNNELLDCVEFEFEPISKDIININDINKILNDFFTYKSTPDEVIENFKYQLLQNLSFVKGYVKDSYKSFDKNLMLSENIIINFHNWTQEAIIEQERNHKELLEYSSKLADVVDTMQSSRESDKLYEKYQQIVKEIKGFYFNFTEPTSNIAKTKRNLLTFSILSILFITLKVTPKPVQEKCIDGLQSPFLTGLYMNISSQWYLSISHLIVIAIILYLVYSLILLKKSFMSNYEQHKFELKDKIMNFVTLYYQMLPEYKFYELHKYFTELTTLQFTEDAKKLLHDKEIINMISIKLAYIDDRNIYHQKIIQYSNFFMKLINYTLVLNENKDMVYTNKLNWNLSEEFIDKYNNTLEKGNLILNFIDDKTNIWISDIFGDNFQNIKEAIKSCENFFDRNTYLLDEDILHVKIPIRKHLNDFIIKTSDVLEIKNLDLNIENEHFYDIIYNVEELLNYKLNSGKVSEFFDIYNYKYSQNGKYLQDNRIIDIIYEDRIKFYDKQEKTFLLLDINLPLACGLLAILTVTVSLLYHSIQYANQSM